MLPKKNRANSKEVDFLFKKGSTSSGDFLFLKYYLGEGVTPKISFLAPKKLASLATERNRLKRMGYLAISSFLKEIPLINGVFTFKNKPTSKQALENDIKKILNKIN